MVQVSIIIYPAVRKKNKITGKIPLYIRFFARGQKREKRLAMELTPEEYKLWINILMIYKDTISTERESN